MSDFPWNRDAPEAKPLITDPKITWKWSPGTSDEGGMWSWDCGLYGSAELGGVIAQAIVGEPDPGYENEGWRLDVSGRRTDGYDMEVGTQKTVPSAEEGKRLAEEILLPLWAADRYAE